MKTFSDQSHMPFGKYGPGKGDHRRLVDVPASYMLWLWEDAQLWDKEKLRASLASAERQGDADFTKKVEERLALHNYMADRSTFHAIEMDAKDVIVRHRPE